MNGALPFPIEILPQGSPRGVSMFGASRSGSHTGSGDHETFAAVIGSMAGKSKSTGASGKSGDLKSDHVDAGGSTKTDTSRYADLIPVLVNMSKPAAEASAQKTAVPAGANEGVDDLYAKIEKEISSLLGGNAGSGTIVSAESGSSGGQSAPQVNYAGLEKILSDPQIKADLDNLAAALAAGRQTSGGDSKLVELPAASQESGRKSSLTISQAANQDFAAQALKSLTQILSAGKSGDVRTDAASADQGGGARRADAAIQSAASTSSQGPGNLERLLAEMSGKTSDKVASVATERIVPDARAAVQGDRTPVENSTSSALSKLAGLASRYQGLYDKTVAARVFPGTTGSSVAPSGPVHVDVSGSSSQSLSAVASAASSGSQKTAVASDKANLSEARPAVGGVDARTLAGGTALARQESDRSNGKMSDPGSSDSNGLYQTGSIGSTPAASFKHALTSASQTGGSPEARPDPAQVAQTIVRGVNMMNEGKKTTVTLKLQPESLGSVSLQVSSESGKISAQFDVKTPDARAFLEASIPQMKQMLQTNGISLSHLSVSLSGGEAHSNHPQQQPKRQQSRFYAEVAGDSEELLRTFGYNTMEIKV